MLVKMIAQELSNGIPDSGHLYASVRASKTLTPAGELQEMFTGMDQVKEGIVLLLFFFQLMPTSSRIVILCLFLLIYPVAAYLFYSAFFLPCLGEIDEANCRNV